MGKLIFLVPGGSIIHYCACAYGCGLYILSNETFCFPPSHVWCMQKYPIVCSDSQTKRKRAFFQF